MGLIERRDNVNEQAQVARDIATVSELQARQVRISADVFPVFMCERVNGGVSTWLGRNKSCAELLSSNFTS